MSLAAQGELLHTALSDSAPEFEVLCLHMSESKQLLTYKRHTSYDVETMGILTVRLTEEEELLLDRRSRKAGMKKATYVRQLIREEPFITASDVLVDAAQRMGDSRLRIPRK